MIRLKKQEIINVAIDLFAEKGVSKVSIKNIADELGASTGKVYHYFSGKDDIIAEILQLFEDCVKQNVPDRNEWESENADAKEILSNLYFSFPADESNRLRKIVRIIMSEMFFNKQIAEHAKNYLITGREELLASCFQTLAANGKINPLDADSAARFLNSLLLIYAIKDALLYPYNQDSTITDTKLVQMERDCGNFMGILLDKR